MEEKKYSVYMHRNKINNKVYVGITSRSPEDRWGHNGRNYKDNPYFWNAIQKYGWNNFEHIVLNSHLTKQEAEECEVATILIYNSANRDYGYNIQLGGSSVGCMSEETKQKISSANKGKPNKYKGIPIPEERKEKIGIANSGNRIVIQYDRKTGEFINYFTNLKEASSYLKIDRGEISMVCNRRAKSIKGYIFRYEDEGFKINEPLPEEELNKCENTHIKSVKQYDKDGNFIKEYSSISEAEKAFGKEQGKTLIWHCVNHKKPSALGFLWSYSDEEVIIPKSKREKPVNKYDKDLKLIQTFPSVKEAAQSVNGTSAWLIKCIKKDNDSFYRGYIWRYA